MNQPLYKASPEDTIGGGGNAAQARRVRAREARERRAARWTESQERAAQQAAMSAQQSQYANNYRSMGEPGMMYNAPRVNPVDDRGDALYLTQAQWDAMTTNPTIPDNPYATVAYAARQNEISRVRGELPLPAAAHSFDNEFVL